MAQFQSGFCSCWVRAFGCYQLELGYLLFSGFDVWRLSVLFDFGDQVDSEAQHDQVAQPNDVWRHGAGFGLLDAEHQQWVVGEQNRDEANSKDSPEVTLSHSDRQWSTDDDETKAAEPIRPSSPRL